MKKIVIVVAEMFILFGYCYSQKKENNTLDTCLKRRFLNNSVLIEKDKSVDTLTIKDFSIMVDCLWLNVSEIRNLSLEDDKKFMLIINTVEWSEFDKQDSLLKTINNLDLLSEYFYKNYLKILYCKYTVYLLSGVHPYFLDLKIQYSGNPYECARYFIQEKLFY